jgi:hypothetical protein
MKRPFVTPFGPEFVKSVRFGEPTPMARGGSMINVFDAEGRKLAFQTPKLRAPFGLDRTYEKPYLAMSCDVPSFEKTLRDLETAVLDAVVDKYETWFGKAENPEVVRGLFVSTLRDDPLGRYPATWKVSIPMYAGRCQTDVFDERHEESTLDVIERGSNVVVLVEMAGLWFVDRKFGIRWKPLQILATPPPPRQITAAAAAAEPETSSKASMFIDE